MRYRPSQTTVALARTWLGKVFTTPLFAFVCGVTDRSRDTNLPFSGHPIAMSRCLLPDNIQSITPVPLSMTHMYALTRRWSFPSSLA